MEAVHNLAEILNEAEENMYKDKMEESQRLKRDVIKSLLKNLEIKSFETEANYATMQNVAEKIDKKMGLSQSELTKMEVLIPLHDIGKVNIAEEILNKKGPLTDSEWVIIKKHPETGYGIIHATDELALVAEDVLSLQNTGTVWDTHGG